MNEAQKVMSAIETIVKALAPLESGERHRTIHAALLVLDEKPGGLSTKGVSGEAEGDVDASGISLRGQQWMKQNGLSMTQLEHVFDISDGAALIIAAEISGKNNGEKTINAYVLSGIATLLSAGNPAFEDKDARQLCENLGCYDSSNHSKYMKEKGNNFTGSKEGGWKLTAPGLKYGAALVKSLAGAE